MFASRLGASLWVVYAPLNLANTAAGAIHEWQYRGYPWAGTSGEYCGNCKERAQAPAQPLASTPDLVLWFSLPLERSNCSSRERHSRAPLQGSAWGLSVEDAPPTRGQPVIQGFLPLCLHETSTKGLSRDVIELLCPDLPTTQFASSTMRCAALRFPGVVRVTTAIAMKGLLSADVGIWEMQKLSLDWRRWLAGA